jgi:hypothetical protein
LERAPAATAGMTTSPQFRESPLTANFQGAAGVGGAAVAHDAHERKSSALRRRLRDLRFISGFLSGQR